MTRSKGLAEPAQCHDVVVLGEFPLLGERDHAVAEGVVKRIALDLEHSRARLAAEAEEQGLEFDPTSVTEPITIVQLDGTGAVVR